MMTESNITFDVQKPIKAQTKVLMDCYSGLGYTVLTREGLNPEISNNQSV